MPRRRRRAVRIARPLKVTKYSNETYAFAVTLKNQPSAPEGSQASDYISFIPPSTALLGTRKVKNFTITICCQDTATGSEGVRHRAAVLWNILFVPEGNLPLPMQYGSSEGAASMQEPNQNVIMSGIVDDLQIYRYKTRLARNLNSGDTIVVHLMDMTQKSENNPDPSTTLLITVNYAISF